MGYYINPPDMTKEEFLQKHGKRIDMNEINVTNTHLPVCLIDNGWMTAAGIAYDAHEIDAFRDPDGRPKKWYSVPREVLKPYYNKE